MSSPHPLRAPIAWFLHQVREVQAESGPPQPAGGFELGVCLTAIAGLMVIQFASTEAIYLDLLQLWSGPPPESAELHVDAETTRFLLRSGPYYALGSLLYWIFCCVAGYLLIPLAYLKLTGRRIGDYYLGVRGFLAHKWFYLGALILMLPVLAVVSYSPAFQLIYPFYVDADRSWADLLVWELAYALQFFALEFFFRAFLLQGLRRSLGVGAVFVMLVPYCMVHFPKTAAESAASVVAGLLLGVMAMRSRSIWGGVLVHASVALVMDVASLAQKGQFPPRGIFPDV